MDKQIDYDLLFSKDAFKNIDKKTLERIKILHQKMQNASGLEILSILQEFRGVIANEKPLTPTELNDITSTLKEVLTDDESKKFDTMVSMLT